MIFTTIAIIVCIAVLGDEHREPIGKAKTLGKSHKILSMPEMWGRVSIDSAGRAETQQG